MQPHWAAIPAISGHPGMVNGSAIPMERLIPSAIDSNGMLISALASGYVRQAPNVHPSTVLPGSSLHSAPSPYNPHQPLGFSFHPSFPVSAHQSLEPVFSGRQFANASLNPSYHIQHLQQPGSATQPLSHAHVPYGHSLPYLPSSLVTAMGNGGLGHIPQCANVPSQSQQVAIAAAMAAATQHHTFDSLKHFGALPQNQHVRRKPTITSKTNLYISGLQETDTDETVRSLVENVIQPKSCKAMIVNGNCKGSGFIDCASEEDAEKAKTHIMETAKASGRKLIVKYAFENEKDPLNVYVRHLPREGFTKEDLEACFKEYGRVTSVKLHETGSGFTGIGFVRFATAEEAEKAVEQMNEQKRTLKGSDKPINCKLADKADPRRRIAAANAQAAAVRAEALAVASGLHQPLITLGNHLPRTAPIIPNPSVQTLSQPQQPAYAHQIPPTAPHLIQPFQQTPIALPSVQPSAHPRGILIPTTVLPNGAPISQNLVPVSFSSACPPNANGQQNANTVGPYRNLVASSNNVPLSGVQDNNVYAYTSTAPILDTSPNRSKTCGNVLNGTSTQSTAHVAIQSLSPENSITPALLQQAPLIANVNVPNGSQMVILAPAPLNCVYHQPSPTTSLPTSTINESDHLQSLLRSEVPNPVSVTSGSIKLINAELQLMSFNEERPPAISESATVVKDQLNNAPLLVKTSSSTCQIGSTASTPTLSQASSVEIEPQNFDALRLKPNVLRPTDQSTYVVESVSNPDLSVLQKSDDVSQSKLTNGAQSLTVTTDNSMLHSNLKSENHLSTSSDANKIPDSKSKLVAVSQKRLNRSRDFPSNSDSHGRVQSESGLSSQPMRRKNTTNFVSTESCRSKSHAKQFSEDSSPSEVNVNPELQITTSCSILNPSSS